MKAQRRATKDEMGTRAALILAKKDLEDAIGNFRAEGPGDSVLTHVLSCQEVLVRLARDGKVG